MSDNGSFTRRQGFASDEAVETAGSKFKSRGGGSFKGASEGDFGGFKPQGGDFANAKRKDGFAAGAKDVALDKLVDSAPDWLTH